VNAARQTASNVYAANPIQPTELAVGQGNYIKSLYPEAIKKAAMIYLNAGVTKANALQRVEGYKKIGFVFKLYEVQVLEANYGPIVQRLKDDGIRYVTMVANYQSIQKLLGAMDQADWYPEVRDWDSVAYSQNFLKVGAPANGSLVFTTSAIYEEVSSNPEMQLYAQWLNRVAPGTKPDYFGFYAWSAGRLFAHAHQAAGAKITRKGILAALKAVHSWNGNGLHASHDIGGRHQSNCFMYVEIKDGKFVRKHPGSGFECNMGGLVKT
jgi:ABC-type branched-subunit amino acid transport system substrate-binding protein